MDKYAINEKKINELRKQLVSDIKESLHEKGYNIGDSGQTMHFDFSIEFDRLLIDGFHTDHVSIDNLMVFLHDVLTMIPK